MAKEYESDETYVPLSRGIRPYLKTYTSTAISLYNWILSGAEWKSGKDYGTLWTSYKEMSDALRRSGNTIRKAIHELSSGYPLSMLSRSGETAPPFIEIAEESGTTRDKRIKIRILKAKMSGKCFQAANGKKKKAPARRKSPRQDPLEPRIDDPDTIEAEVDDYVSALIKKTAGEMDIERLFNPKAEQE